MALFPAGAPSWARTAVNLTYQPIHGVSKIAYVDPLAGDDGTGQVYTFDSGDGDYRANPATVNTFATGETAIAAVGRDGPHAVLFANDCTHTAIVTSGGCQGLSAAHPYLLGSYWRVGTPAASLELNMAQFDPGVDGAAVGLVETIVSSLAAEFVDMGGDIYEADIGVGVQFDSVYNQGSGDYFLPGTFASLNNNEWGYSGSILRVKTGGTPDVSSVKLRRRGTTNEFILTVQRGSGFSNLIVENLAFVQAHRIASDPGYTVGGALDSCNFWRAMRVYGGNQYNILFRNIHVHSTSEGIAIEAVGHTSSGQQLHNVVLDNVCVKDVWQPGGTYEGVFVYGVRRLRVMNSCLLGNGHNRLNLSLAKGDTAQGRNQGLYLSFVEDPWIHNSVFAHNSHAGIQARCGGTVTSCFFWANARNLGFGHGQNQYESRSWNYIAKAYDNVFWGSRDVGAGYPNPSATPLEIGEGLGCGRVNSVDFQRNIVIGEDTYRSSDENFGINIGTTPGGGTVFNLASNIVYDFNASGVSTSGEIGIQSGAATGATLKMVGNRIFSKRGKAIYVQGSEPTTKARLSAASMIACRAELTGTAALYGPSGTAPANVTSAFVTASVRRGDTWNGTAPPLEDVCGFADESELIEELTTLGSTWDARRILNIIRTLPQFGVHTIQSAAVAVPNQPYEGS